MSYESYDFKNSIQFNQDIMTKANDSVDAPRDIGAHISLAMRRGSHCWLASPCGTVMTGLLGCPVCI